MDQQNIGKFIAQKRKEQNLTQEQLAQCLGVSNKTVSKWETGKCMPDYSVVKWALHCWPFRTVSVVQTCRTFFPVYCLVFLSAPYSPECA